MRKQGIVTLFFFALLLSCASFLTEPTYAADNEVDASTLLPVTFDRAAQGDAGSQATIGLIYSRGMSGFLQDYGEAVKWFRLAAEQGHAEAQAMLGAMYGSGQDVAQDYVYGHMWTNLASTNGAATARELRDIYANSMTPEQIERAQELARNCLNSGYADC